ncbi:MAG: group II intron reverse transcriptase/maturase [Intestinibacter bartlettii]
MYNYYKLASNISTVMNKIYYTWKDSWELTMGRKLKLTKAQVRKSHILNGKLCVSYKNNKRK